MVASETSEELTFHEMLVSKAYEETSSMTMVAIVAVSLRNIECGSLQSEKTITKHFFAKFDATRNRPGRHNTPRRFTMNCKTIVFVVLFFFTNVANKPPPHIQRGNGKIVEDHATYTHLKLLIHIMPKKTTIAKT